MQKKIIALAIAAAFAAPVSAMAAVTMYGSLDGGLRHQTNPTPANGIGNTTDTMQMGQYNTSRFGLKSVEDMGDGMKANVVLETSLAPTGVGSSTATNPAANAVAQTTNSPGSNPFGLLFDRQATIGVSAGWGTLDMGWNYTASFKTIKTYDPFDYKYLGVAGAKSSDYTDRQGSVAYGGKFGDVSVIAEYYVNNGVKTAQPLVGPGRAVAVNYANGTINMGGAYTVIEATTNMGPANSSGPITHVTAGAGFKFGDGKVSVGYAKRSTNNFNPALPTATDTNMWVGASFKVSSKVAVTAAYYSNAKNTGAANAVDSTKKTIMAGVTYDLSKATQLYLEMDKATSGTAANPSIETIVTGTSLGLSTSF